MTSYNLKERKMLTFDELACKDHNWFLDLGEHSKRGKLIHIMAIIIIVIIIYSSNITGFTKV